MSNCMVLGDKAIHQILISLAKDDIEKIRKAVTDALKEYSVGEERSFQPEPSYVNRPNGQKTLFRPFTSPSSVGVKIVVTPAKPKEPLHGIVALCDDSGLPTGFLNAEELTGYRTSLSPMIIHAYRRNTANIIVFGAGKQALWHLRLVLALRGADVKRIHVVNRSFERAESLVAQLRTENNTHWKSSATINCIDVSSADYDSRLQSLLADADVVFCTTPSKEPLFPARYLVQEGTKRNCYVSAIGSWQADMIELDPEMLKIASAMSNEYLSSSQHRWAIVVDDAKEAAKNTGEIVQSEFETESVAEIGQLMDFLENATLDKRRDVERWLEEGFVVYKSVGVSIMDLVIGNMLLSMASERNLGMQVADF